jgi:hypothetical protein
MFSIISAKIATVFSLESYEKKHRMKSDVILRVMISIYYVVCVEWKEGSRVEGNQSVRERESWKHKFVGRN